MNHKLYELINAYQVQDEQEKRDRAMMLKLIALFPDIITRNNDIAHFTASPWIINRDHTKVLMVYHHIYDSWSWCGGHLEGVNDPFAVALKEGKEESGLAELRALKKDPLALNLLPVHGHFKHNEYIASHLHLNLTYLCEADDRAPLSIKTDENSEVKWFSVDEINRIVTEKAMLPVYQKLINKMTAFFVTGEMTKR